MSRFFEQFYYVNRSRLNNSALATATVKITLGFGAAPATCRLAPCPCPLPLATCPLPLAPCPLPLAHSKYAYSRPTWLCCIQCTATCINIIIYPSSSPCLMGCPLRNHSTLRVGSETGMILASKWTFWPSFTSTDLGEEVKTGAWLVTSSWNSALKVKFQLGNCWHELKFPFGLWVKFC